MSEQKKQQVVLIRHGETEWARAGRHTSFTDLSLTEQGRAEAKLLQPVLAGWDFKQVFTSTMKRAQQTCQLAGLTDFEQVSDLGEWNYGRYEGLTIEQIQQQRPDWNLYSDGCPEGESVEAAFTRIDRLISRIRSIEGDVALFSHGHTSRAIATRWINLPIQQSHIFALDTATLNLLGTDQSGPVIIRWNVKPGGNYSAHP